MSYPWLLAGLRNKFCSSQLSLQDAKSFEHPGLCKQGAPGALHPSGSNLHCHGGWDGAPPAAPEPPNLPDRDFPFISQAETSLTQMK